LCLSVGFWGLESSVLDFAAIISGGLLSVDWEYFAILYVVKMLHLVEFYVHV
jgi:hypothetical protein